MGPLSLFAPPPLKIPGLLRWNPKIRIKTLVWHPQRL
jgi:hypothetical protein